MKLRDKIEISNLKALERKKEIDEGVKLAKKVDTLRELSSKEQDNLIKFREESLREVKSEIAQIVDEKNVLLNEIHDLREKREKLLQPIDLTQEWDKVNTEKLVIVERERNLLDMESELIARETATKDFFERERVIKENEERGRQYLTEATKSYDLVEQTRNKIEANKRESDEEISNRMAIIREKEQEIISRDFILNQEKEKLSTETKELLEKGTNLIQRESTVEAKTKELVQREETLKENENLNLRYITESKKNYDLSESVRVQIEESKKTSNKDIQEQYKLLTEKQREFGYKERDLILEKEQIAKDKEDIVNERKHITSQQETLKVAWNNIKQLQK